MNLILISRLVAKFLTVWYTIATAVAEKDFTMVLSINIFQRLKFICDFVWFDYLEYLQDGYDYFRAQVRSNGERRGGGKRTVNDGASFLTEDEKSSRKNCDPRASWMPLSSRPNDSVEMYRRHTTYIRTYSTWKQKSRQMATRPFPAAVAKCDVSSSARPPTVPQKRRSVLIALVRPIFRHRRFDVTYASGGITRELTAK